MSAPFATGNLGYLNDVASTPMPILTATMCTRQPDASHEFLKFQIEDHKTGNCQMPHQRNAL